MYPIELSDTMRTINPVMKIKNLYLVYLAFSFEFKIKSKEIKINNGKYKGPINLLNSSL